MEEIDRERMAKRASPKLALKAHKEGDQKNYDRFLIDMGWHLKMENIISGGERWEKSIVIENG